MPASTGTAKLLPLSGSANPRPEGLPDSGARGSWAGIVGDENRPDGRFGGTDKAR